MDSRQLTPEFQRHLQREVADFGLTTPRPDAYSGPFASLVTPLWARRWRIDLQIQEGWRPSRGEES